MNRLAADVALVGRLGAEARTFAEGFTWENAADQTEHHLMTIVARGAS
jgi:hypothetical protein